MTTFVLTSKLGEEAFKSKNLGDVINFAKKAISTPENWNVIEYEITLEKTREMHRQPLVSLLLFVAEK